MATVNPFDLLGDDDNDDPSQLIAAQQLKIEPKKPAQQAKPAKLPTKPVPPAQAVREAKGEGGRGRGRGGGRGFGRGRVGGGFNRDSANNENSFSNSGFSGGQGATVEPDTGRPYERRGGYGGPRGSFRGGHRGGFNNGETGDGEPARRTFERHSGTGRSNEVKREGAGRGNWGTPTDEISQVTEEVVYEGEKDQGTEKPSVEEGATDVNKENPDNEAEEKEPEAKEMTLEEYEKVLEEKRKALQALKTEERKVDVDKEFKSMQQLSNKKANDDIFFKLGSDKDKRKELAEREEKAKKSLSINEFLKPAEGEKYYSPGSRGRGRGRGGSRGGYSGGGSTMSNVAAPKIEDPGQFPTLGAR
ncbi:RGG repeats nuclear RNA binding protein A-like isoform X1 [Actinidia eriantha]|uniref:RGG repeats nuclear RNA binding protein A-like isoform X1 n=1 Tax=Actinidia eriantha TaxID=165200 RepID=UPI00258DBE0E|nr:RGG repeats nuclear RNA binding protein A-like isoform X1 [Actinidia eriantha]